MSIWKTLDIDPTTDKRAIKRAYSKMASRYHPEEQPEKFQEVYEAYEQAIAYAERNYTFPQQPPPDNMQLRERDINIGGIDFANQATEPLEREDIPEPAAAKNRIAFDEMIPRTPRQELTLGDTDRGEDIPFDEMIPGTPRHRLTVKDDEESNIDFEKIVPNQERGLSLKQQEDYTINFQSIVKDEDDNDTPDGKKKKTKRNAKAWGISIVIFWFIWGLINIFIGEGESASTDDIIKRLSRHEPVKQVLEEKYGDEFYVSSIDAPETIDKIYYLIDDGKKKEDYQWFYCSRNDGRFMVQFYAALDDFGAISYNYSYQELIALIEYVGLDDYLDVIDMKQKDKENMEKGERKYCYPILKLSSGNLNEDFFKRLGQLADMIQESKVQFENSEQLTINIKDSDSGAIHNLHITKEKKADRKTIRQELMTFFGK